MVVGSHLEARSVTTHKPVSWLSDSSHFPGRRTARRTRTERTINGGSARFRSAIDDRQHRQPGNQPVVRGRPRLKASGIVLKRPLPRPPRPGTDTEPSNNYVTSHEYPYSLSPPPLLPLFLLLLSRTHARASPMRFGGRRRKTLGTFSLPEIDTIKGEGEDGFTLFRKVVRLDRWEVG